MTCDLTKPNQIKLQNGPPAENHETYFLCEKCHKRAPDAILHGLATEPKKMTRKDHIRINGTVFASLLVVTKFWESKSKSKSESKSRPAGESSAEQVPCI